MLAVFIGGCSGSSSSNDATPSADMTADAAVTSDAAMGDIADAAIVPISDASVGDIADAAIVPIDDTGIIHADASDGALGPDAGSDSGGAVDGTVDAGSDGTASADPTVPAELLDLSNWKLTLPIGDVESPLEITQPELATYDNTPYFTLSSAKDAVLFRAHAGGVTTSGSSYPRSELREMVNNGTEKASWSTSSGTHIMEITQAITHLPVVKPHVVAGQIHDANDDVIVIRLEGEKLFIDLNGTDGPVLDTSYQLGTVFTVRFEASGGKIKIFYNGAASPAIDYAKDVSGCYFKAGVYTQSNTSKGDEPDAYGEVAIYALSVEHH